MDESAVGVCQFEPAVGDIEQNLQQIESIAVSASADVLVFPELCLSGYDLDVAQDVALTLPCTHTERLATIADETDAVLVVGLPERASGALYNSAIVVDEDGIVATYRKQYPTGGESDVFDVGDETTIVETPAGKMGVLICYDMSFPEAMIPYGNAECDFVAVPSAWRNGWHDDWRLLARARALESTCYVAASNQRGSQGTRFNDGESLIASPYGNILTNLKQEQYVGSTAIDSAVLDEAREYNPVVQDRQERQDDA